MTFLKIIPRVASWLEQDWRNVILQLYPVSSRSEIEVGFKCRLNYETILKYIICHSRIYRVNYKRCSKDHLKLIIPLQSSLKSLLLWVTLLQPFTNSYVYIRKCKQVLNWFFICLFTFVNLLCIRHSEGWSGTKLETSFWFFCLNLIMFFYVCLCLFVFAYVCLCLLMFVYVCLGLFRFV